MDERRAVDVLIGVERVYTACTRAIGDLRYFTRERRVLDVAQDLEILARPGLRLSEQGTNDPYSYRLAIFSEWGETREEAVERCRARAAELRFDLRPV